jgi:hypothetical protein
MKKPILSTIFLLLFFIIFNSGCIDNNTEPPPPYQEKVLGEWAENIPGTPLIVTMNFVTNMSYYESINNTRIWGTYTMTKDTIALHSGDVTNTFEYTFSNNWTQLTLIKVGNENIQLELIRKQP